MNLQTREQSGPRLLTGRLTEVALGYQRMLQQNPRQPEALVGICLVALASGQNEAAIKMAQTAAAEAPSMVSAWVALGQAFKAAHRSNEAETAYQQALRLEGMNALARMGLGELKLAIGQPEAAIWEFGLAVRRQPTLVSAYLGLGNALAVISKQLRFAQTCLKENSLQPSSSHAWASSKKPRPATAALLCNGRTLPPHG